MIKNVMSYSGGKDSTAMLLQAKEWATDGLVVVAADTGHEHPLWYDYVQYISDTVHPISVYKADFSGQIARKREFIRNNWAKDGVPEERITLALEVLQPTGIPFLDLCLWKGRFPSTKARFCSQELKHNVIWKDVEEPLLDSGYMVTSWQGVRREESRARAQLWPVEWDHAKELAIYRPIVHWTVEQVFAMHKRHGIKPNPLYKMGAARVGCFPCIHCGKEELRNIAMRFPEEIARIREWERMVSDVSKRGVASFFAADKTPQGAEFSGSSSYAERLNRGETLTEFRIDDVVEWAKTSRGGRQYDMLVSAEDYTTCSSRYGLCE